MLTLTSTSPRGHPMHDAAARCRSRAPAAEPAAASREITMPADDGYALAATLFEPAAAALGRRPAGRHRPGAPAVPRRFYARFAAYLAERGHPVLTFDYRGIGGSRRGSLKGSHVRMRDWCIARRAGRARLGRAHLSRPAAPLGRPQHGRFRHRPRPQQPPGRPPAQRRHAQRLLGPHGRARALPRARPDGLRRAAGRRARDRLHARPR